MLPFRSGVSANGVAYYYTPAKRFSKITEKPEAKHRKYPYNSWYFEGNLNPNVVKFDLRNPSCHLVPVKYAQNHINKDGLSLFSDELIFFCKNCKKKLMINSNPMRLFELIGQILIIYALAFLITLTFIIENGVILLKQYFIFGLTVPIVIFLINLLCTIFFLADVKNYESNFVPTDEFDNLIYPQSDIVLRNELKSVYLREGNVFQSGLGGEFFYIYLIHKNFSLNFHICGIDGEPERFLSLIREKQERGEKVTLSLTFEGKFVGNAEVLETYDSPRTDVST